MVESQAPFQAGDDPANYTVSQVVGFLMGDAGPTADEYDRIMAAEQAGKARAGILSVAPYPERPVDSPDNKPDGEGVPIAAQATQTPDQARALAAELAQQWKTPTSTDDA